MPIRFEWKQLCNGISVWSQISKKTHTLETNFRLLSVESAEIELGTQFMKILTCVHCCGS